MNRSTGSRLLLGNRKRCNLTRANAMKLCVIFAIVGLGISSPLAGDPSRTASPSKAASPMKTTATAPTTQLDRKLLKNRGGEAEGKDSKHVPDWQPADELTEVKYGSVSGKWDWGRGCATCGNRYLRLAFEVPRHEVSTSQTIDVTRSASDIDRTLLTASIPAYPGRFRDSDTTSILIASFQGASGTELGKGVTKPYDGRNIPKAPKGSTGLVSCQASEIVPAGTKTIVFTWKTGVSSLVVEHGNRCSLNSTLPAARRNSSV
jgi:hypothetical protein